MKKIREKKRQRSSTNKINQNWTSVLQGQLASSLVQNEVRRTLVGSWSWYLAHGNSVRPWNFSLQWIMNNALVGHPWTSHLDAIDSPFKLVHFKGRVNHLTAIFWEHKPSSSLNSPVFHARTLGRTFPEIFAALHSVVAATEISVVHT